MRGLTAFVRLRRADKQRRRWVGARGARRCAGHPERVCVVARRADARDKQRGEWVRAGVGLGHSHVGEVRGHRRSIA